MLSRCAGDFAHIVRSKCTVEVHLETPTLENAKAWKSTAMVSKHPNQHLVFVLARSPLRRMWLSGVRLTA